MERDWPGNPVGPYRRERYILGPRDLEEMLEDYTPRSKRGRLVRKKLPIANAYEETKKDAEAASGIWAAQSAFTDAQRAMEECIKAVMAIEPRSMAGVVIQAKAMLVYAATAGGGSSGGNGLSWVSLVHGNTLAKTIVALAGAGPLSMA